MSVLFENYHLHKSANYTSLPDALKSVLATLPEIAFTLGKAAPKIKAEKRLLIHKDIEPLFIDAYTHCLRNSIDHGLEQVNERQQNGKPDAGTITLDIDRDGDNVIFSISDDGRGLNLAFLQRKGLEQGILVSDNLTDGAIAEVIFHSGTSSASQVSDISGRGVGMDAVRSVMKDAGANTYIEFTGPKNADGYRPFRLCFSFQKPADNTFLEVSDEV